MTEFFDRDLILYINIFHFVAFVAFAYMTVQFVKDWICNINGLTVALAFFTASLMLGELWSIMTLTRFMSREASVLLRAVQLTLVAVAFGNLIVQHRRVALKAALQEAKEEGERAPTKGA